MTDILIIDNNLEALKLVNTALGPNYNYQTVKSLEKAYEQLSSYSFAAIILDISIDIENSFNLLRNLDQLSLNRDTPVIITSAKDSTSDIVHAFSLGAEDFIIKPYDSLEFRARVEARIIKRLKKNLKIQIDGLNLEPHFQRVTKEIDGKQKDLQLTPIEFKILYSLIESKGRPLSRESLINLVWDKDRSFESRGIDAHVSNLRRKLGSQSKIIGSVYGVGYVYRPFLQKNREV